MKYILPLSLVAFAFGTWFLWPGTEELEARDFSDKMAKSENAVLVDLRTNEEFAEGHIPGALNITYGSPTFRWRIGELDSTSDVFLYCGQGSRSMKAVDFVSVQGFSSVTLLKGGFTAWQKEKFTQTPPELVPPAELTEERFNRFLELEHLVVVYFDVPWSKSSRRMGSVLDELAVAYKGKVQILRVNADTYKYLATELGMEELPLLQFYENGNLTGTIEGAATFKTIDERFKLQEYVDYPTNGDNDAYSL
ncbi:MAG TPA: rhodanese-like domain-containing protein [Fluviicola sp.]|nr:rhodanese-like domain-containing protein [Fluviicola sp.]